MNRINGKDRKRRDDKERPIYFYYQHRFGIGGLFPMILIVPMDHIHDPQRSGNLAAFTQGIGYIIAGISPLIAGLIRSATNSFQYSWLLLALIMTIMIPMALSFNPYKYGEKFD